MRGLKSLLIVCLLSASVSCSQRTLSLFFDIPAPKERKPAAAQTEAKPGPAPATAGEAATPSAPAPAAPAQSTERPEIEKIFAWEEADKMLPRDVGGQADWMQALRQGIIEPRGALDGPGTPEDALFKFDFFFPGPAPTFDAYFPHSAHTEWLGCDSCHPKIFRKRGTEISMEKIGAGEYCGVCHGKVAFGTQSCARCHPAMGGG